MQKDLIIHLPDVSSPVIIQASWIAMRDRLVEDAGAFPTITDEDEYELASEVLQKITKANAELEAMRKKLANPFQSAGKLIKNTADAAREPLEKAKENLKSALAHYAVEQRRKAEEERNRIKQAEKKAAEKLSAERRKLEESGLVHKDEPIVLPVIPKTQPQIKEPKASTTRISEHIEWTVADLELIPEEFKSFDRKKLNAWVKMKQDTLKEKLSKGSDGTDILPGIRFTIETSVASR